MRTFISNSSFLGVFLLFNIFAYSQNATIDYQAWNPSNPPCNIFAGGNNVPANIGGNNVNIYHGCINGQPKYNSSARAVELPVKYNDAGDTRGTKYRLAYSFKQGHTYSITVNAAEAISTKGTGHPLYLRLAISNSSSTTNAPCSGPDQFPRDVNGTQDMQDGQTYKDYNFAFPNLPSANSSLDLTAYPGGQVTPENAIRIRKIIIIETAPAASFTLPATTSITCGSTSQVTFTITNVNNITGVADYTWNFGSIDNGWVFNGAPALPTISTGTNNSITLTPACGVTPKNISATVTVNNNTYTTNTLSVNNITPPLAIVGSNSICSNQETYSIPNLPCNSSVTWNPVAPSGIVSTEIDGNNIRLTRISDGTITLSATINSPCNVQPVTKTINVQSISNTVTATLVSSGNRTGEKYAEYQISPFNSSSTLLVTPTIQTRTVYQVSNNLVEISYPCTTLAGSFSGTVQIQNACGIGNSSATISEYFSPCGGGGRDNLKLTLAPNPAKSSMLISLNNEQTNTNRSIQQVQVLSLSGRLMKIEKYSTSQQKVSLNLSNLKADVYLLRVFDGTQWITESIKVIN